MMERGGRSQEIGTALRAQAHQMFHQWHRVCDGTLYHATEFRGLMRPIRCHLARLLKAGQTCGVAKTEGVCREMLKVYDALWTFVRVEGVEPTNNAAERTIRSGCPVAQRQPWENQSANGSRFVEAMMTVVATLQAATPQCPCVYDGCMSVGKHSSALPPHSCLVM